MRETIAFRPVGDTAVLVDFGGESGDRDVRDRIRALDAAVTAAQIDGVVEQTPALTSLLIIYDPLKLDFEACSQAIEGLLGSASAAKTPSQTWRIPADYSKSVAPDINAVAEQAGLTPEAVAELHASAAFEVSMYGFAPGYAYLTGLPAALHLPRKPAPVRDVPAGSILIAGDQCLISTLTLPTGWWVIGRAGRTPLQTDTPERPFLFEIGDTVRFERVSS